MSKEQPETETTASDKALPSSSGSAYDIAVKGYMADRAALISQIPEVNLYYPRDQEKRKWMVEEIDKIDSIVARLVVESSPEKFETSLPNSEHRQP